ncbi:MAG: hypothetical protein B7Y99_12805 [Caulobacterales bacterium 32-69-10]|nr:MAG: hypothetical protein B7Y99_12805 [Caulobacterales bacterium 32-69-10]
MRVQRADNQRAGQRGGANQPWQSINQRQAALDSRIDQGVRNGSLNRREATRLRGEFQEIARLEARYRATNGLQASERADLDVRFDRLSGQIRMERADRQTGRGVGSNAGYNRR